MSIPSYNHFYNYPIYDRYERRTGMNLDYYSPGTKFGTTTVNELGSYVIRCEEVLYCQLLEMFNRDQPDIYSQGEYISKGVINIDKKHMFEYLHQYNKNFVIPSPGEYNRYIGDTPTINYIHWKFTHSLAISTNGGGKIYAFRLRYTFPANNPLYSIRAVTWALYKNLMDHIICYSYWYNPNGSDAIDIIVSNAPFRKLKGRRRKTLSGVMNYVTSNLNSDIDLALRLTNPRNYNKLKVY